MDEFAGLEFERRMGRIAFEVNPGGDGAGAGGGGEPPAAAPAAPAGGGAVSEVAPPAAPEAAPAAADAGPAGEAVPAEPEPLPEAAQRIISRQQKDIARLVGAIRDRQGELAQMREGTPPPKPAAKPDIDSLQADDYGRVEYDGEMISPALARRLQRMDEMMDGFHEQQVSAQAQKRNDELKQLYSDFDAKAERLVAEVCQASFPPLPAKQAAEVRTDVLEAADRLFLDHASTGAVFGEADVGEIVSQAIHKVRTRQGVYGAIQLTKNQDYDRQYPAKPGAAPAAAPATKPFHLMSRAERRDAAHRAEQAVEAARELVGASK